MTAARREAGFVLVGVVIFVLALTIVGLSLFSISGYEAQFLQRSVDAEQAYQSAMSGLEHARFALGVAPYSLANAAANPPPGVTSVRAFQMNSGVLDSTGMVNWNYDGKNYVLLRAAAGPPGGPLRVVEAKYEPQFVSNAYRYLIASARGVFVERREPGGPKQWPTVILAGAIWDGSGGNTNTWLNVLHAPLPDSVRTDALAAPPTTPFIAAHALAPPAVVDPAAPGHYVLSGSRPVPAYYTTPQASPYFSLHDITSIRPRITVDGYAVWVFPQGVRFDYGVQIEGTPGSCLAIVADPCTNPGDEGVGIQFFGGLHATIPLILVSSGEVRIRHYNNDSGWFDLPTGVKEPSQAQDLAIYAGDARITGPREDSGNVMLLQHVHGGALDIALDDFAAAAALPGVGSEHHLRLLAGTWLSSER